MPEARVQVDGEQFSIEVNDLSNLEQMNLAMRAPSEFVDEMEGMDEPPDDASELDCVEEMVDYFEYILVEVTKFDDEQVQQLSLDHLLELGSEVLNVALGEQDAPNDEEKRVKRVRVTKEFVEYLFTTEAAIIGGLPDDASLEGISTDPSRDALQLTFSSSEWNPVAEGAEIPVHQCATVEIGSSTKEL